MSKLLYLLRHADSVPVQMHQTDVERDLSMSGIQDCIKLGEYLAENNFCVDIVYASSSTRTRTTSRLVAEKSKINPEKIIYKDDLYEASVRTFLQIINSISDMHQSAMFVGHNPVISNLAEYFTRRKTVTMDTCTLVSLKFETRSWKELHQGNGEIVQCIRARSIRTE